MRQVLEPFFENALEPADLRTADGRQLVIPAQAAKTLAQYVRFAGRQGGVKEVMVPACVGTDRDTSGLHFAQDAYSSTNGRNAVTNMLGGLRLTQPGDVELIQLEENFGMNGGSFDAQQFEESMYKVRCRIQALTDCDLAALPTAYDVSVLMSDGCPVITGERRGSQQKMQAVSNATLVQ